MIIQTDNYLYVTGSGIQELIEASCVCHHFYHRMIHLVGMDEANQLLATVGRMAVLSEGELEETIDSLVATLVETD